MSSALRKRWPEHVIEAFCVGPSCWSRPLRRRCRLGSRPSIVPCRTLSPSWCHRCGHGAHRCRADLFVVGGGFGARTSTPRTRWPSFASTRSCRGTPQSISWPVRRRAAGPGTVGQSVHCPPVRDIATASGPTGAVAAFASEFVISPTVMLMVLYTRLTVRPFFFITGPENSLTFGPQWRQ